MAGAGLLSHLSAGAFLLERSAAGLLRADELSGRSTHVSGFASPEGLVGVAPARRSIATSAPWTAPRSCSGRRAPRGSRWWRRWGRWRSSLAGALGATGGPSRTWRALLAVVLLYEGYLRWAAPLPLRGVQAALHGVVPGAGAGRRRVDGARRRARARTAWPHWPSRRYALGLGITWGHTVRFLSLPWGAMLPEAAMNDARRVAGAVQPGPASTSPGSWCRRCLCRWRGARGSRCTGPASRPPRPGPATWCGAGGGR